MSKLLDMVENPLQDIAGIKLSAAWHGSPHDFDKFSLDAIGTGEGAQVHGWGLYFAKEREVSEGYRERLSGRHEPSREYFLDGKRFDETNASKLPTAEICAMSFAKRTGSIERAISRLREGIEQKPYMRSDYNGAIKVLQDGRISKYQ